MYQKLSIGFNAFPSNLYFKHHILQNLEHHSINSFEDTCTCGQKEGVKHYVAYEWSFRGICLHFCQHTCIFTR